EGVRANPVHGAILNSSVLRRQLAYLFPEVVKRPKKSLQPFVLVIQDCLLRARSLCSVNPTVRRVRDLVEVASDSLTLASAFSFLLAAVSASPLLRVPNSLSFRVFFIVCSP